MGSGGLGGAIPTTTPRLHKGIAFFIIAACCTGVRCAKRSYGWRVISSSLQLQRSSELYETVRKRGEGHKGGHCDIRQTYLFDQRISRLCSRFWYLPRRRNI